MLTCDHVEGIGVPCDLLSGCGALKEGKCREGREGGRKGAKIESK